MNAHELDVESVEPIDRESDTLKPGSGTTPMSTFIWAVAAGDIATAEAQITDDIEWGLMPYNKVLKGKSEVIPWLRAASSDQKTPIAITNAIARDWGSLNTGTSARQVNR